MDRTRRLITAYIAAIVLIIGASTFASIPTTAADPICGTLGRRRVRARDR